MATYFVNIVPELIHGKECLTAPSTQEMLRTQLEEEDAVQHHQRLELSGLITATVNPGLGLDRYWFSAFDCLYIIPPYSLIPWSVRSYKLGSLQFN